MISEEELEERRKKALEETKKLFETRDTPPTIDVVKEEKIDLDTIFNISVLLDMGLNGVIKSNMLIKDVLLRMIDDLTSLNKQVKFLKSSQPTSQEIAEIVNKAISSYNETNKKNIEELNKQSIEEISKKIDEANKQTIEESNLYQTQIIQMFKDLIENVNKLNNKVDRLESVSQKKEMTEKATQSTIQTFANGLHSSKKVTIENISKKDLECDEGNILNNKKLNSEDINKKKEDNNKTPLHTSEVNNTILEDTISEKNQQSTTKRQVVINDPSIDKTRVVNEKNKNIDKPKVSESHEKLYLKTIMKTSRKTTIIKYKEKVGNDYTKEQFKNNKEIGIGCKHRAFLRFDGGMTKLSRDVFEKDTKLEKDTYYIEREGQKYLVFRNIDSANADVPNDSFTLMKLPEGCQKIDNDIIVDILNKARIDGIDGENSILIDSIEELQGLVVADEKIKNRYFDEAKNRRVCSLLSGGDLMKTYTSEFEKGCKENEINNYKDYMPLNDGQLEFRSEKEINNDIYIKPYVEKVKMVGNLLSANKAIQEKKRVEYTEQVENLPTNFLLTNSSEKNEKTSTAELVEKLKMYNSLNRALIPETEINL